MTSYSEIFCYTPLTKPGQIPPSAAENPSTLLAVWIKRVPACKKKTQHPANFDVKVIHDTLHFCPVTPLQNLLSMSDKNK